MGVQGQGHLAIYRIKVLKVKKNAAECQLCEDYTCLNSVENIAEPTEQCKLIQSFRNNF